MMTKSFFVIILLSGITFSQWIQQPGFPPGAGITDLVISGTNIVVTTASFNYPSGQLGGMRYSSDGGQTWNANFNCYTGRKIVTGQNNNVFASAWNYPGETEALYKSTNNGVSWSSALYYAGSNNNIFSILVKNNNQTVYIGTRNGVHRSTNGGTIFSAINSGIPANSWVRDLKMDSLGNIAAATTNGLFISTNNGSSWSQATGFQAGDTVVKLQFFYDISPGRGEDPRLFAGTDDGRLYALYFLTLYQTATLISFLGNCEISDIAIKYLEDLFYEIVAVTTYPRFTESPGFHLSTDNGMNFKTHNTGLPANPKISALTTRYYNTVNIRYTIGTFENSSNGGKIYTFTTPIGIVPVSNEIPEEFSLLQNYPNPFNPDTKIRFTIPITGIQIIGHVQLTVYDILGREIVTLVNESLKPGTYEVDFDGSKYSSGVYLYKLTAGDFIDMKKMIITK